jgi:hypothetical protein
MSTNGGSAYICTHGGQEPGRAPTRSSHEVHQRNLQMRRERRRELQESPYEMTQLDDGEPGNTDTQSQRDADVTDR